MTYKQTMKHWHNHRKQRFSQPIVQGFSTTQPRKEEPMKGLICKILTDGSRDPLAKLQNFKEVTLIGKNIEGVFEPAEDRPAVTLITREIGGREYKHVVPCDENAKPLPGWFMASGAFIYDSDGRFPSSYPLSLHDRQE